METHSKSHTMDPYPAPQRYRTVLLRSPEEWCCLSYVIVLFGGRISRKSDHPSKQLGTTGFQLSANRKFS